MPVSFSAAPLTLSVNVGFLPLFAGAFLSTRPAVLALARGLEILAFGVDFLVVAALVLVLVFAVVGVAEVVVLRGALLPVDCRVAAITGECGKVG